MNSEYSLYTELLCTVLRDVAGASCTNSIRAECERDIVEIRHRVRHEGICFLTKTLPSLGKSIDNALASGTALQAPNFARRKGSQLPKFFGWLLERVFSSDGWERRDADPAALGSLRQLTYLFYKLELPFDEASVTKVIKGFEETDRNLTEAIRLEPVDKWIAKQARRLISRVLANANPRDIVPRHGPGAVSTGEKPWEKPFLKRWYPCLESMYPLDTHMFFNLSHLSDRLDGVDVAGLSRSQGDSPTAKVVLVPKDSRGPRLISMEPLEIQWVQQGLKDLLVETIESAPLTSGFVNFTDQEVNRRLALEASRSQEWVTLDMKDASDRVHMSLVEWLFPENWVEALHATRSTRTMLPDGKVLELNKFAPMGSAVCFPVEALVFWALSVAALSTRTTLRHAVRSVYVYGDDIITKTKDYGLVMQHLERFGLMFNRSKCCTHGSFRESCGLDAYKGVVITPLRVKRRWCRRLPVEALASWVSVSNALHSRGLTNAADFLEVEIRKQASVPYLTEQTSTIAFVRPDLDIVSANRAARLPVRYNARLQRREVRTTTIRPFEYITGRSDWEELLFHQTKRHGRSLLDRREPERKPFRKNLVISREMIDSSFGISPSLEVGQYSLPRRVSSKRGWTPLQ